MGRKIVLVLAAVTFVTVGQGCYWTYYQLLTFLLFQRRLQRSRDHRRSQPDLRPLYRGRVEAFELIIWNIRD